MNSVELFTGIGGLAIGVSHSGFQHLAVVEWDRDAAETIRENQRRRVEHVQRWPLYELDVRDFDYGDIQDTVDLVAGGPPCQPFSLGGKHRGHADERNMFPEVVRAVRELKPRAFLIENVKGLARQSFANYLQYICLQLTYPDLTRKSEESWIDHLTRLEQHKTQGRHNGLSYQVVQQLLNAADYGVPQRRERVFLVGVRSDLCMEWSFPIGTYSQDALIWEQWVTGEYWERHCVAKPDRPSPPAKMASRIAHLRAGIIPPDGKPWLTVRDAIGGLPDPALPQPESNVFNHNYVGGARIYPGHTGSPLDEPGKTLKAGDHGVPGGENMLAYPDGSVRYLTVRESARLQTFPDEFVFHGSWTHSMRQLGNAVPVMLARAVATELYAALNENRTLGRRSRL